MSTAIVSIDTSLPTVQAPITPDEAHGLVITSQESLEMAHLYVTELKAAKAKIEEARKKLKAPILEAGRRLETHANEAKAPLLRALAILEPRITTYIEEQKRIEREEQRRLEAEARKQAEEEQLAAAEAAEAAGASTAEVDAILTEEPPPAPMPSAPRRYIAPQGMSTPTTYSAECIDKAAFLRHVVATRQYHLVDANEPGLNALARSMRDRFSVPGCRLVKKTGVRTRG